ncbi:MAG: hypothetical protein KDK54_21820 [Leptospiraceae bacterium]|nr:hypothetical protein [Leptospiraceae bacterium]
MSSIPITSVSIDTPYGIKEIKLYNDNITNLTFTTDIIFISAFKNDYSTDNESIIGQLYRNKNIDVSELLKRSDINLKNDLFVWISKPIEDQPFKRVGCIELTGRIDSTKKLKEAIKNIFIILSIAEYNDKKIETVSMPILGSGDQMLDPELIVPIIVELSKESLKKIKYLKEINFVERSSDKAIILKNYINQYLKREEVKQHYTTINKNNIDEAIINKLKSKCQQLQQLLFSNEYGSNQTIEDLLISLKNGEISLLLLSAGFRKLVETFTVEYITDYYQFDSKSNVKNLLNSELASRLAEIKRNFNKMHNISSNIFSRFFELREFGNSLVHESGKELLPKNIHKESVIIYLYSCINFIDFWILYRSKIESNSE